MWQLTIYQRFCNTHEILGKKETLEGEHPISFKANTIGKFFDIIGAMSCAEETDVTRYEIKKVVE